MFERCPQVLRRTGVSKQTLYRWIREGRFPRPARLGPNVVGWPSDELEKWEQERKRERDGRSA